jgi:alpha 1,2-mannosyltransferase
MFRNKKNVLQFFCLFGFISLLSFIYSNQSDSDFKPIKGCILILARNNDLGQIQNLIKNVDLTFNKKYKYPFILFNDEEFSSDFQNKVSKFTNSTIEFGIIAKEHWNVPSWINGTKLNESVHKIGHSIGYRQMCRFNSGFFFQHELTLKYDYYMRLDSDSGFECELNEDPFRILKKNNQKYSFILSYHEGSFTIPTLWQTIKQWANKSSIKMNRNGLSFITDDNGISLNGQMCIFYNNFEMAEFSLFRNEQYQDFFHSIDKTGGFFYERWVN